MPSVISVPCLAAILLMVAACDGVHAGYVSAGGTPAATARSIYQAYAERDACLARNATERALAGASSRARAQALALACAAQTDRLITASSRGDATVASAIRDDTEFRALGVVLRASGAH